MQSKRKSKQQESTADTEMSTPVTSNWNVPDTHLIHLQPRRIIGSGSFGKPSLYLQATSSKLSTLSAIAKSQLKERPKQASLSRESSKFSSD